MQIFVSDKGYAYVVAMRSVSEFPKALKIFAKEVDVTEAIIADSHKCNTSKEVKQFCRKVGTTLGLLEGSTQWVNRAELYVGFFKEDVRKDMLESNSPLIFWDYCAKRRAVITNMTAKDLVNLRGQTPQFATFGKEGDISNICQLRWYEGVYFREATAKFPFPDNVLGRCLGQARNEGNEMTQWILKQNGKIVPRRTMCRLTQEGLTRPSEIKKRAEFDAAIEKRYGNSFTLPKRRPKDGQGEDESFDLPFDEVAPTIPEADDADSQERPLHVSPDAEVLLNAKVFLPQGEELRLAKVIQKHKDSDG